MRVLLLGLGLCSSKEGLQAQKARIVKSSMITHTRKKLAIIFQIFFLVIINVFFSLFFFFSHKTAVLCRLVLFIQK
jgi:hypothetical protein